MNTSTQHAVIDVVSDYIEKNGEEYNLFKAQLEERRGNQNTDFAEFEKTHAILRQLGEFPEALFNSLKEHLTEGEMEWFRSKDGQAWFIKRFPEFSATRKV